MAEGFNFSTLNFLKWRGFSRFAQKIATDAKIQISKSTVRSSCVLFFAGKLESRIQDAGFRAAGRADVI